MFDHILRTIGAAFLVTIIWAVLEVVFILYSINLRIFFFIFFSWLVGFILYKVYDDIHETARIRAELFANAEKRELFTKIKELYPDLETDDDEEYEFDDEGEYDQSGRSSQSREKMEYEQVNYQCQVLGGTSWLNVGGPRNEMGAIESADREKNRNPNKRYRVVELRNGRVCGTVYSC